LNFYVLWIIFFSHRKTTFLYLYNMYFTHSPILDSRQLSRKYILQYVTGVYGIVRLNIGNNCDRMTKTNRPQWSVNGIILLNFQCRIFYSGCSIGYRVHTYLYTVFPGLCGLSVWINIGTIFLFYMVKGIVFDCIIFFAQNIFILKHYDNAYIVSIMHWNFYLEWQRIFIRHGKWISGCILQRHLCIFLPLCR
jgi:hypothetical protein